VLRARADVIALVKPQFEQGGAKSAKASFATPGVQSRVVEEISAARVR